MGAAVKHIRTRAKHRHQPEHTRKADSPLDSARPFEVLWDKVSGVFEGTRPYEDRCFVYFIGEENGPVKIGLGKNPVARRRHMQIGNPRLLRIERVLVGNLATEKLLHELWRPFAIVSEANKGKADALPGTEWFGEEIRDDLYPVVDAAAERQISHLSTEPEELVFAKFEVITREAHIAHHVVAQVQTQARTLASAAGYTTRRKPSRI